MPNVPIATEYPEINADLLKDYGVLDVIRNPLDGINGHPDIPWHRLSSLALAAMYLKGPDEAVSSAHYSLRVHFKNERPRPMDFSLRQQADETFAISTFSGTTAGQVPLSHEVSSVIAALIMESLQG